MKEQGEMAKSVSDHSTMVSSSVEKELEHGATEHTTSPLSDSASSIHSNTSSDSDHSDPLDPLERALTVDQETPAEHLARPYRTKTATSVGTTGSRMPDFEVDFEPGDPEDPRNWPLWYKSFTVGAMSLGTLTTVLYSTSYTSAMPGMMIEFNESSEPITTLGVTAYLLGLASGSLILAPMSEIYGRRPVYIIGLTGFMLLLLPCALAKNLYSIIITRYFGAVFGSCMVANSPGTISDITNDNLRAFVFSIWAIGPMNGPVFGPVIGGFVYQYLGWRWTNWIVLIISGVGSIMVASVKETYAPVLLQRKAAARRKEMDDDRYWSRYDQKLSLFHLLKVNLSRPFVLTLTEPILWFWDIYIAIIYGILYLCFVAYPIVFSVHRGWSPGISGLSFSGIGIGTMIAICMEPVIRRIINSHAKDPETGKVPPEAAVSVICVAAICVPVGQLVFSWTSLPVTIPWIISILAGIPFGFGNAIVFIYASNYIAGSYGIYAASALAGNSVVRSFIGGTLPLAGPAMYAALTPQWAGTLLGLLEVALIPIPFVFYKYGAKIRSKSRLIKQMREGQEKAEKRAEKSAKRAARANREPDVEQAEEEKKVNLTSDVEKSTNIPEIETEVKNKEEKI